MKKIFYILIAVVASLIGATNVEAQTSNGYSMATGLDGGHYKFVIEGTVALNIPDSCYNIYLTDINSKLNDNDLVACVKVKDKKFRYEADINVIKQGRIRAIMPGNELCPAWIEIYFIPGFTVFMTVHDGYYTIDNKDQYNFMVAAWQNEVPVSALLARLGIESSPTLQDNNYTKLNKALDSYHKLIIDLRNQLNNILDLTLPYEQETKEKQKILQRIEQINAKMENLVDEYVKEINQ